jgi:hypothetical protein
MGYARLAEAGKPMRPRLTKNAPAKSVAGGASLAELNDGCAELLQGSLYRHATHPQGIRQRLRTHRPARLQAKTKQRGINGGVSRHGELFILNR